jgi:hypothetical protein
VGSVEGHPKIAVRITKDVPIVRGDHGALKAILLGVWHVAASSLGDFCDVGSRDSV